MQVSAGFYSANTGQMSEYIVNTVGFNIKESILWVPRVKEIVSASWMRQMSFFTGVVIARRHFRIYQMLLVFRAEIFIIILRPKTIS